MKIYHEKSGRRVELLPEGDKIKSIVYYDWYKVPSITYFSNDLISDRLKTELLTLGGKVIDYSNDIRDYVQQNLLNDVGDEVYSLM